MKHFRLFQRGVLTLLFLSGHGWCQTPLTQTQPLSPRIANYQIQVQLNPAAKQLDGKETLVWRNTSNDIIRELPFHLYLNAFRNGQSTFMRESGGQLRGVSIDENDKEAYGWTNIQSMRVRNGEDLTRKAQAIHPDDNNGDDRTVIRVPLTKPIQPGESITIDLTFRAKLPKIFARTGYDHDYFLIGQWFPKIGVYERAGTRYRNRQPTRYGQWNCHQFHANSEFFADFGVYDVTITTPKAYVVGATGLLQNERINSNGTKTGRWHAEDVVDFAWTASPHFKTVDSQWRHVKIRALMQPEHEDQADRHIEAAKVSLAYFDKHLGRYPFPNLTIVDPPVSAMGSAGMEYPTFITSLTSWGLPRTIRIPEITTVHEFGHQYFMQLLATNEFEEAWMDEGFNQYYEGRVMDETYGAKSSVGDLFGFRIGDLEMSRDEYVHLDNPAISPSVGNVWDLPNAYYGTLTYFKTATWLRTLEGLVGRPVMDEIMRTYFNRWQFKHPHAEDFIAVVNAVATRRLGNGFGPTLASFFDQVVYGTAICDYELHSVRNAKQGNSYQITVTVYRRGDAQLPIEVLVHFEDGKEDLLTWDGKASVHTFTLTHATPADWARADPKQKLYLDVNFNNNSYTIHPSAAPAAKYATKFMFWVQNWMQWLAWLV